jgi:uncharacterized protein YkwD
MSKRIVFSLSLLAICFGTLSAQTDNSAASKPFPSKPVPVVTSKGVTTAKTATQGDPSVKKTVPAKPAAVAGKGVTTTGPDDKVPAKTPTKTVAKTPEKPKTTTAKKGTTKTVTKKSKHKTVTKATTKTVTKAPIKAVTPVKTVTTAPLPTTQTKTVLKPYTVNAVKVDPKPVLTAPKAAVPMSFNNEMLAAVNALRKSGTTCGTEKMPPVKPLAWNVKLANAASIHVVDMDSTNHFSHAGLNGTLPDDRIKAAGYEWSRVGENIGQGYKNVAAAIKGWQESPNHCKEMMNAQIIHIGAAKKGNYWCQTFAAPLE